MFNIKKKCYTILMTMVTCVVVMLSMCSITFAATKNIKLPVKSAYVIKLKNSTGKKVNWNISQKKVASITYKDKAKAVIQAKKNGTTRITAKVGKKKYTYNIKVYTPKSMPKKITLVKGSKYAFPSKRGMTWGILGMDVLSTVNRTEKKFTIIAKSGGTVTVENKYKGKTKKCAVTVVLKNGESIDEEKQKQTLAMKERQRQREEEQKRWEEELKNRPSGIMPIEEGINKVKEVLLDGTVVWNVS